ncbi:hypothetical protein Z043_110657 [Scleropages formosus]|uniref:Ig-like domain-containing protein n=1 Tax=Scleropages formosus TaxID=113540 RepID=A0A0P7UNH7_SCLFO|nr:hypothetical protein Z043_110657 [Scleropages formosus]
MTMPREAEMKNSSSPGSNLSPWEEWVISKARQDRLRMEQKVREEASLKEAKMQQEKEQERRKITVEKKITEWLQMKRDQEKVEKQLRMNKALEEKHYKEQKKRETEEKAQKRYMEWLQKKNQEAMEKKQKEKEETVRRDLEARERKQRSEEEFKKWLMSVKHKPRPAANTSSSRRKMAGLIINAAVLRQKPFVTAKDGGESELTCKQDGSDDWMYWYRRSADRASLGLLFFSRSEFVDTEKRVADERLSARRDGKQFFYLRAKGLKADDTAVYFCASSIGTVFDV